MPATRGISGYSDEDLAQECIRLPINEEPWREFWRRFYPLVYRKVVSMLRPFRERPTHSDVEDLVQLVFVKIFKSLSSYDRKKSPLPAYLSLLTAHTVLDQLRQQKRMQMTTLEGLEGLKALVYKDQIEVDHLWRLVLEILERLEPLKRAIVVGVIEGESVKTLSEQHKVTPSYVSTTLYRFRQAVKAALLRK